MLERLLSLLKDNTHTFNVSSAQIDYSAFLTLLEEVTKRLVSASRQKVQACLAKKFPSRIIRLVFMFYVEHVLAEMASTSADI